MRKLLILFAAALVAGSAQAQTTKGTVALTGSFGYTKSNSTIDRNQHMPNFVYESYDYTLSPSVGFFIRDNLELGATFQLQKYNQEYVNPSNSYLENQNSDSKAQNYKVYARQYKYLLEKLAVYGNLSAGMNSWENNYRYSNTSPNQPRQQSRTEDNTLTAAIAPGLAFFPSRKVGFSVNLGALEYRRRKKESTSIYEDQQPPQYNEQKSKYRYNTFELDFSSLNLNFGLTYFIGK